MVNIPDEVKNIANKLSVAGFEAHLVGGCVRDLALNKKPKDWDIATNALPTEIQTIFPDSVYENDFGTVAVKTESEDETLKIVEITTYRLESDYSDFRRPNKISFSKSITEDLSRRDFTINALAFPLGDEKSIKNYPDFVSNLKDPYNGLNDLQNKIIRAVGDPNIRFSEDALRLLRAIRLSAELNFNIESETLAALKSNSPLLKNIATERIRDEIIKIIITPSAADTIRLLQDSKLLQFIFPELSASFGVSQNKHHTFDVFEHSVRSLEYAAQKNFNLEVRLAALLHDIGKPATKKGEGENATFYAHEVVGAKMARVMLSRLCFPKKTIDKVAHLVRYHMFNYNVDEVSEAGVRRFIARVGEENIDDLLNLREADRIGSGVPKAFPYKLRHLLYMIDKVRRDPISPKMLNITGDDIIKFLNLPPSPRLGMIIHALLEEVIDDPSLNNKDYLLDRAAKLNNLSNEQLNLLMSESKKKQAQFERAVDEEIKNRYYVK